MSLLRAVLRELVGMFLADGRLPVWLLAWIAACGAGFRVVPADDALKGALLVAGALAILVLNVVSAVNRARRNQHG